MGIDIRLPIGGMFSIMGVVLLVYGVFTQGQDMYARSLGYNVNIWWGIVMLVFGVSMLGLTARKRTAAPDDSADRNKSGPLRNH